MVSMVYNVYMPEIIVTRYILEETINDILNHDPERVRNVLLSKKKIGDFNQEVRLILPDQNKDD